MKTIFFNPFQKYSDYTLLTFGLTFGLIGVFLGFIFNARFDGFIDLHFVEKTTFYQPLFDTIINIFSGALIFFIIGKLINRKTRIIDILVTCLIAKIPFCLIPFANINQLVYNTTTKFITIKSVAEANSISSKDFTVLIITAILTILIIIWSMVLLFSGFKTATNAKQTKHTILFILGIIAAEIISKILILTFIK